jgi:outer membrane protein assembly factor BamB
MSDRTSAAASEPEAARRLRLWPAVVVLCVQAGALAVCVTPAIPGFTRFVSLMAGPLVCGVLFSLWLLFAARLRWWEGAATWMLAAGLGVAAAQLAAPRTGIAFWMYGVPMTMVLTTIGMALAGAGSSARRLVCVVALTAAGWGLLSLLRLEGIDGRYLPEFAWRWTPTAEQRLLAALPSGDSSGEAAVPTAWSPATVEWPGFRGPRRDSRTEGPTTPLDWTTAPPREIWRRPVGPAWSSLCVVADRIFTQEQRGADEVVSCYDAATGAPLWQHAEASRFEEVTSGAGPRATPTYDDGRIFAYGAKAILVALDAASGAPLWRHDLMAEVNAPLPVWGFASSPAVAGGLVIVYAGGDDPQGWLAFDAKTGSRVWTAPGRGMNFSSALVATVDNQPTVVCVDATSVRGLDPEDGHELWRYQLGDAGNAPIVQPQQIGSGTFIVPLGDGVGIARIEVTRSAEDRWVVREVWTSRDLKPSFNDFVCVGDILFGFDKSIFVCVDAATGRRTWKGGRYGFGQAIALTGLSQLLVTTEQGEVVVLDAVPDRLMERGRFPAFTGKTWNHPVVVRNRLYARNGEEMACWELSADAMTGGDAGPTGRDLSVWLP